MVFVLLVFLTHIKSKSSRLKYTWMPDSAQLDFMVGISYSDVPVASGLLVDNNHVLTAATPLRYLKINQGKKADFPLHVHVIYREWDKSVAVNVSHVVFQSKYEYYKNHSTEAFDKSGIYAPVHDLASLLLKSLIPTHDAALAVRHPLKIRKIDVIFKSSDVFTIVGHGYADRLHVQQNVQMEAVDYLVEDVLVDCDEWIPRSWGYFVCLLNVDNFVGISSGAALLYNGGLVAVGSFSLTRGDETILVLTDCRKYKGFFIYDLNTEGMKSMW